MQKVLGILGVILCAVSFTLIAPFAVNVLLGNLDVPLAHMVAGLGTLVCTGAAGLVLAITQLRRPVNRPDTEFEREQAILGLAKDRNGRVTVAEIAAHARMSITETKAALDSMCGQGVAEVMFSDDGAIVYEFPGLRTDTDSARSPFDEEESEFPEPEVIHPDAAPFGVDPVTGKHYSRRRRLVAGLLQIFPAMFFFPGVGRIYTGNYFMGLAQFCLGPVFGIGVAWSVIDGLLTLLTDRSRDRDGLPLRPEIIALPASPPDRR